MIEITDNPNDLPGNRKYKLTVKPTNKVKYTNAYMGLMDSITCYEKITNTTLNQLETCLVVLKNTSMELWQLNGSSKVILITIERITT